MVDVMDRRLTRSASNEPRHRFNSQSGLGLRSGRELPSNGIQSNGPLHQDPQEQQHRQHGSTGQGGQQQEPQQQQQQQQQHQQQQDGVNPGENSTYQRNTSEEMFLNTVINSSLAPGTPMIEAASLEFLDNGPMPQLQPRPIPGETPRGDSEELFQNFLSSTSNVEHADGNQAGVDTTPANDGDDQRGNLQRSEERNGAAWDAEQSNLEADGFLPDDDDVLNASIEDKSPSPRSNSLGRERGKPVGSSPLGPLRESSSGSPMTRSKMSELRRQFSQWEGPSESPKADTSLGPGMTPAGASVNGNSNGGSPKTGSGLKSSQHQSLGDSILSSASPVNYTQRVQQQSDHQNHLISDAVGMLKNSIEMKNTQTRQQQQPPNQAQQLDQPQEHSNRLVSDAVGSLKNSLERKKYPTKQQQQQRVNQQQWQNEQKPQQQQQAQQQRAQQQQQQQRGKTGPQGTPRQDDVVGRAQDLREQLAMESDPGLPFPGPLMQDNGAYAQSPTTSSAAAASPSAGFATSDGPSNSGLSGQRQGIKRGNGEIYENGTAKHEMSQKPERLTRAGSITSALEPVYQLNEIDGATKKRRVERVRKMAEAKTRGHAPALPADLQAALKRCDALEKEVRSLKHYHSFMNRKDSEQTKRIEELEEENEQLQNRLQELERGGLPGKRERDVGVGKRTSVNMPGFGNARR